MVGYSALGAPGPRRCYL